MDPGKIIFLNGTSSSGKTTIARMLHDTLDEPYLYISVDNFFELLPGRFGEDPSRELTMTLVSGVHHTIAVLSRSGNNVIVDDVLDLQPWLMECADLMADLPAIFVGVHCDVEELERRERERGDRSLGMARRQLAKVHGHGIYDVEVDTSVSTPAECAALIIEAQRRAVTPSAFARIKDKLSSDGV